MHAFQRLPPGHVSIESDPDMAGFFAPRNQVEWGTVFRNITQHRHCRGYSGLGEGLAPADDCARREIKAALVPPAFDESLFVDAASRLDWYRRRRCLIKERQLQMRAGIIEDEALVPLLEEHGIKAGKFEHLRLALDKRIEANGLMPGLATNLCGLAGSGGI